MSEWNRPEVSAALPTAFGDAEVSRVEPLTGGRSGASVFSFVTGGRGYVLRMGRFALGERELTCFAIAAELGVAPRLVHTDPAARLTISEQVVAEPYGRGPTAGRVERLTFALRRLHGGPRFPPAGEYLDSVRRLEAEVVALGGDPMTEVLDSLEPLAPYLARYARTASCHLDLNPNNILDTGERVLFVDWDIAGAADPFLDLAQLGIFAFPTPQARDALLLAYLERRPTEEESARAMLTRAVAVGVYAAAFLRVRRVAGVVTPLPDAPPFGELVMTLGKTREQTDPGLLAVSLMREMREMSASDAFGTAKAVLAG